MERRLCRDTEASEERFEDFVGTSTTPARMNGDTVRERNGQAQIFRVDGPRRATINVRTDAQDDAWWEFTKNVEEELKQAGQKWFLVLLESIPGKGHMLSDVEVSSAKTRWDDGGHQHIVHPAKLRDLWRFRGVEHVWSRMKSRM